MSYKAVSAYAGDHFQNASKTFNNRTGATSVLGGTAAVDVAQAESESDSIINGLGNAKAVSTALMAAGLIGVWEKAGIADNAAGGLIIGEGVRCKVNVDSTTDISKGDALKCVNAGDHMVKATTGTDRYHAIALEARTSNDEGTIEALLFSSGRF